MKLDKLGHTIEENSTEKWLIIIIYGTYNESENSGAVFFSYTRIIWK